MVWNYIRIMKGSKPDNFDPSMMYEQFYQVNDKVLTNLLLTHKITEKVKTNLELPDSEIVREILFTWLG